MKVLQIPAASAASKPTRSEQARINGSKSKGPVTAGGKAISSRNALKHGFTAQVNILIAPDDSEAWHVHLAGYRDSYNPVNFQETEFVSQLASIAWRLSRLVGIETALIDFQLSIQEQNVNAHFPEECDNPYFHLALAWQGLARKAFPRRRPADPNEPADPTLPPDELDISSIELARRYQVSLDRQFRNVLLNFRQYRKDFSPPTSPTPNEPKIPKPPPLQNPSDLDPAPAPAPNNPNLARPLQNLRDLCADPSASASPSVNPNLARPLRNLSDLCADPLGLSLRAPDSAMLLDWVAASAASKLSFPNEVLRVMSGHSKWATIKHKKGALDAKRGKVFTRLIKEIVIAARGGGGDPDGNPRLRTAIVAAKAVSMPSDNIQRAIKRGTGELEGGQIDEIMFEGYGPGGAAMLVSVATDNRNRTVAEIRHMFSKHGGNMGEMGSVSWMFERKSQIVIDKENLPDEDAAMNLVLEIGADDLKDGGDSWEVISGPENHVTVLEAIQKAKIPTISADIAMIPKNLVTVEGKNAAACIRLTEALDEQDDVQNVYSNFDIDENEMEALAG